MLWWQWFHNVVDQGQENAIDLKTLRLVSMQCSLVTGAYNVAFGHYASCRLTSGTVNVAVGTCAGRKNQTGSGNVHLGVCRM